MDVKNTAECLFPGVREHSRIFLRIVHENTAECFFHGAGDTAECFFRRAKEHSKQNVYSLVSENTAEYVFQLCMRTQQNVSFTMQETQQNVSSAEQKNTAECFFRGV
jgi:hypothetical protein